MGQRIKCKLCGDVIESKHHYDFRECSCSAVAIDGGDEYTRIIGSEWEAADG